MPNRDDHRVLGIDPGLSRCGYGLVEVTADGPRVAASGVLCTPADEPLPDRLRDLAAELDALLDDLLPDAVAVERVLFQVNARTAMQVGQASGIALLGAARRRIPVAEYSPNEVKQAVTGHGGAGKAQVEAMVRALLGLREPLGSPDAADALALALCHLWSAPLRALAGPDTRARVPGLSRAIEAAVAREATRSRRGAPS